ncbi:MAG: dUTP diphosphatase [bacterium]|nr:dUTP diphosphatase [Myxococcales bacterium]
MDARTPFRFYLTDAARAAGLEAPRRAYPGDAGLDLRSLHHITIPPLGRVDVPTGVGFEIPDGWYGLICNRTSGGRRGLLPVAHVVDSNYTGEIVLVLHNTRDDADLVLEPNERVAQIVFMPVYDGSLEQIEPGEVKATARGERRFGSSGRH